MRSTLKWFVIVSAILFIVAVCIIFLLPEFIDPNDHKESIENAINEKTNLQTKLNGDMSWVIFPSPAFSVKDVEIENDKNQTLAKIASAQLQLSLIPLLLKQQLIIRSFRVSGVDINIDTDKSGNLNWQPFIDKFNSEMQQNKTNKQTTTQNKKLLLIIDSFKLINSRINYDNKKTNQLFVFENINIMAAIKGTKGSFELMGDVLLKLKESKISKKINVDFIVNNFASFSKFNIDDFRLKIMPKDGSKQQRISFLGNMRVAPKKISGRLNLEKVNLLEVLREKNSNLKLVGDQSLTSLLFTSKFQYENDTLDIAPLLVTLDESKYEGKIKFNKTLMAYDMSLSGDKLIVDDYLIASSEPTENLESDKTVGTPADNPKPVEQPGKVPEDKPKPVGQPGKVPEDKAKSVEQPSKVPEDKSKPVGQSKKVPVENKQSWINVFGINEAFAKKVVKKPKVKSKPKSSPFGKLALSTKLELATLVAGGFTFDDVKAEIKLDKGVIRLSNFTGLGYGGNFNIHGSINSNSDFKSKVSLELVNLDIQKLSQNIDALKSFKGNVNSKMDLNSKGLNKTDIVSFLNGHGQYSITDGSLLNFNFDYQFCDAIARIRKKRLTKNDWSQNTDFKEISGSFDINKGIFKNDDFVITLDIAKINGAGSIDLNQRMLDYSLDFTVADVNQLNLDPACKVTKNIPSISVPFKCSGSLEDSSLCSVDYPKFIKSIEGPLRGDIEQTIKDTLFKKFNKF